MSEKQYLPKRQRGRPITRRMPEPIPDTPEDIARAIMTGPPKAEWDYLKGESKLVPPA